MKDYDMTLQSAFARDALHRESEWQTWFVLDLSVWESNALCLDPKWLN